MNLDIPLKQFAGGLNPFNCGSRKSVELTVGTDLFIGGKIKFVKDASVAFGYSFEAMVLYAQSLDIGTTWLGGTMNRNAFETAMELATDEIMPCASPLGYPAKKMSVRESMMCKAIKADERMPFGALFFDGGFGNGKACTVCGQQTAVVCNCV